MDIRVRTWNRHASMPAMIPMTAPYSIGFLDHLDNNEDTGAANKFGIEPRFKSGHRKIRQALGYLCFNHAQSESHTLFCRRFAWLYPARQKEQCSRTYPDPVAPLHRNPVLAFGTLSVRRISLHRQE